MAGWPSTATSPMAISHVIFRFRGFELDATAYELRRNGRRIRLARQPMDLLLLMLERPGALMSRDEIRKRLWSEDLFVDVDASIRTAVLKIRQVLGDSGESPRFVETVTGKGYKFIARSRSSRRPLRRRRPLPPQTRPSFTLVVTTCRPISRGSSVARSSCRNCTACFSDRVCCR
jgi:DNA-binding winged helix-turn-helix (wHTH) protein